MTKTDRLMPPIACILLASVMFLLYACAPTTEQHARCESFLKKAQNAENVEEASKYMEIYQKCINTQKGI